MIVNPKDISTGDLHQFLLGAVAPRPIAFASTINMETGVANLAPFSFFNAFSSNPPIVVFSANRRVEGNTTKDTLFNIEQNREVVINVVTYPIVSRMALTSVDFPADVSEFDKGGFTKVPAQMVKPFLVKESPVNMECKVSDIITLGDKGGAGHLIICDVVLMHINDEILDERGRIDPDKIDLVGRMGRTYYSRASGSAVFSHHQPYKPAVIGIDSLPEAVRQSHVLSGHELGLLASLTVWPSREEALEAIEGSPAYEAIKQEMIHYVDSATESLHKQVKHYIAERDLQLAAQFLAAF